MKKKRILRNQTNDENKVLKSNELDDLGVCEKFFNREKM